MKYQSFLSDFDYNLVLWRFSKFLVEICPVEAVSCGQIDGQRTGGQTKVHDEPNCQFSEFFKRHLIKFTRLHIW